MAADADAVLAWRNDPETRGASFDDREIEAADHRRWFASKLDDPATRLFIVLDEEKMPVGQVRFDAAPDGWVVSIALAAAARGKGYGREALRRVGDEMLAGEASRLIAFVKPDNRRSLAAFREAGFGETGRCVQRGVPAVRLVRERGAADAKERKK
jgi:RimJ/RimL family protein N-acetyltransferase